MLTPDRPSIPPTSTADRAFSLTYRKLAAAKRPAGGGCFHCLVYMSISEATLGEHEPKIHHSRKGAIAEALEWIGRNPRHRAYIDCTNHQQFTHEDLVWIRDAPAGNRA